MSESPWHIKLKEVISQKLRDWYGCSIQEYPESGHELDVYAVTHNKSTIYVEVIWSPTKTHFLSDLLSIEHAEADVKLAVVNPLMLKNPAYVRKYEKTVISQAKQGFRLNNEMIDGSRLLDDPVFLNNDFKKILDNLLDLCISNTEKSEKSSGLSKLEHESNTRLMDSLRNYASNIVAEFNHDPKNKGQKLIIEQLSKFDFNRYYVDVLVKYLSNGLTVNTDSLLKGWIKAEHNGLFVIGDFGTGKSTLCAYLVYVLAKQSLTDPNLRIPIFISLREIEQINKEAVIQEINKTAKISWDELSNLSNSGKLVIMLDGFDEIPKRTDWEKTIDDFNNIVNLFCKGKSKVIVSCRTHFFKKDSEIWGEDTELMKSLRATKNFDIVSTVPWDEGRIVQFIKKRCDEPEKIWSKINETYNLKDLSSRPLLIDMILSTLPKLVALGSTINAVNLYDKYTEDWIMREDWRSPLNADQKAELMERLAFKLFCQDKYAISFEEIKQLIESEFGIKRESAVADYYDYDIRTCSFFRRDGSGNYSFMHKSFLEFFVAKKLSKGINFGDFADLRLKSLTKEILFFMSFMIEKSAANTLLVALKSTRNKPLPEFGFLGGNSLKILIELGRSSFKNEDFSFCRAEDAELECDFEQCSFDGIILKNVTFDAHFSNCTFVGASVMGNVLNNTIFDRTDISQTNFNDTTFDNVEIKESKLFRDNRFKNCKINGLTFSKTLLAQVNFIDCSNDFSKYPGVQFIDSKIESGLFQSSNLLLSAFQDFEGSHLSFLQSDFSGSCFCDCLLNETTFEDGVISFSTFDNIKFSSTKLKNMRAYDLFMEREDLDSLALEQSNLKLTQEKRHRIFRPKASVIFSLHLPAYCELDCAIRKCNLDYETEQKVMENYEAFWDTIKGQGVSAAMATSFYATMKESESPMNIYEVQEVFSANDKIIAKLYRKLLRNACVKHVSVDSESLIEKYSNKLHISKESELLAKKILLLAQKNRLPQGRNRASDAAASLCIACNLNSEKVTLRSLAETAKLSTPPVHNAGELILKFARKDPTYDSLVSSS